MSEQNPWSRKEFETKLRSMENKYHIHHPMHTLMNEGKLNQNNYKVGSLIGFITK